MSDKNFTHMSIVLDRSQSMSVVRAVTINGFNNFLREQKAVPGRSTLTLIQFDDQYTPIHTATPLGFVSELNEATYQPRGYTALLDAIGRTIDETGAQLAALPEEHRPGKVVFVVITDGEENCSRKFTRARVFEMIEHQRKNYAWEFVFLGANQDAIQAGSAIGIEPSNSMTFAHNDHGTQSMYASLSANTVKYRSGVATSMAFTATDRAAQDAAALKGGSDASPV